MHMQQSGSHECPEYGGVPISEVQISNVPLYYYLSYIYSLPVAQLTAATPLHCAVSVLYGHNKKEFSLPEQRTFDSLIGLVPLPNADCLKATVSEQS